MTALAIAIIRGVVGLCIIAFAIFMLILSIQAEGAGCGNGIILAVVLVVCMIIASTVGEKPLTKFFGTDFMDVFYGLLVTCVGCLFFASSRIVGALSSVAVGILGLLVTGFLSKAQVAVLSQGFFDVGIVIMLPIVIPMILLILLVSYAFRG